MIQPKFFVLIALSALSPILVQAKLSITATPEAITPSFNVTSKKMEGAKALTVTVQTSDMGTFCDKIKEVDVTVNAVSKVQSVGQKPLCNVGPLKFTFSAEEFDPGLTKAQQDCNMAISHRSSPHGPIVPPRPILPGKWVVNVVFRVPNLVGGIDKKQVWTKSVNTQYACGGYSNADSPSD